MKGILIFIVRCYVILITSTKKFRIWMSRWICVVSVCVCVSVGLMNVDVCGVDLYNINFIDANTI
jgi:hypothetical protein